MKVKDLIEVLQNGFNGEESVVVLCEDIDIEIESDDVFALDHHMYKNKVLAICLQSQVEALK